MRVEVAFSGVAFGGTVATFLHDRVLERFPFDNPDNWWHEFSILQVHEQVRVRKERGGPDCTVNLPTGNPIVHSCDKPGQLAIIADKFLPPQP